MRWSTLAGHDLLPIVGEEWKAMKESKFTAEQVAFVVKQGEEGTPVADLTLDRAMLQAEGV